MRRKKFQIVAALLAAFFVVGLHGTAEAASENDDVTVNFVRVDKNGYGYIQISANTAGSPPACGTSNGYANSLAFDTNTPGGKSILSVATARSSRRQPARR
jgi:hypothetical protein